VTTGVVFSGYNRRTVGKERHLGMRRSARFDERLFEEQLWYLHKRSQRIARVPTIADLTYTIFALRLLWVAVIVPFLAGAACAFLLGR
jgi:hypothetical protein